MFAVVVAVLVGTLAPLGAVDEEGHIVEYARGISNTVSGLTAGPDGNLWFTEPDQGWIGRITLQGKVTEFSVALAGSPLSITAGPDGNVWFTEAIFDGDTAVGDLIGRITPQGDVTEFPLGIPGAFYMEDITAGPDGNVWFAVGSQGGTSGYIGRITPAGKITLFSAGLSGKPWGITVGADGNLWASEQVTVTSESRAAGVARITPTGVISEYPTRSFEDVSLLSGITTGSDGNVWFGVNGDGQFEIVRMTPEGVATAFPAAPAFTESYGITTGCDGNVWFGGDSESGRGIGRITPKGKITVFSTGSDKQTARGITAGSDGNVWYSYYGGRRIGRIGTGKVLQSRGKHGPPLPAACTRGRRKP